MAVDIEYNIGYYYAFTSTQVNAYYQDDPTYYTYWYNINFPWTNNQSIELINTYKKTPIVGKAPPLVLNPQSLKPVGNFRLNTKVDKNAINVPCK